MGTQISEWVHKLLRGYTGGYTKKRKWVHTIVACIRRFSEWVHKKTQVGTQVGKTEMCTQIAHSLLTRQISEVQW